MPPETPPPEPQPPPHPHRRRRRYRGTHPRRFSERYKEFAPERYPEMQSHIIDQGRTPAGMHVPILVAAVAERLRPAAGDVVADCTLGYGGHARLFLSGIQPNGVLIGLDIDGSQLERTGARLKSEFAFGDLRFHHSNFAGLEGVLAREGLDGCDIIFADLGVSSMQIDDPARGFSYKHDGPLDMRMDARIGRTAVDWLRTISARDLAAALADFADEPDAEAIAAAVVEARQSRPLRRTRDLVDLILSAKGLHRHAGRRDNRSTQPAQSELHPAALTFQALRILVNDELGALRNLLRIAPRCLRPGGRIGILTFHSGEDRLVKQAFRDGVGGGVFSETCDEPVRADAAERRANPRSSAAKFRWAVRALFPQAGSKESSND